MTKEELAHWFLHNSKQLRELFIFIFVVIMGTITKTVMAMRKGTKFTIVWFFSELIMSFFVAITVYAIFDQFLQVNKLFSYTMCAWCGTFSTVFHERLKDFLESIFEFLKMWIKIKIK